MLKMLLTAVGVVVAAVFLYSAFLLVGLGWFGNGGHGQVVSKTPASPGGIYQLIVLFFAAVGGGILWLSLRRPREERPRGIDAAAIEEHLQRKTAAHLRDLEREAARKSRAGK
jgi:hypothetical protein